jgi:large subunit ribosomal protein L37
MLQLCESSVGNMSSNKVIAKDVFFKVPLQRNANISLNLRADLLLLSDTSLAAHMDDVQGELPDLYPLDYKISLDEINIYNKDEFISPITGKFNNIHTAFIHYNETEVKNLYETPVLQTQIIGRSLMKCYAFAVANAKSKYGEDVKELPEPITLQCVHTNSQWFHFSIFQLNSLAGPEENGMKNIYWQTPLLNLYKNCVFDEGVPVLEDYNPEVFKHFLSFYMNGTEYEIK